MKKQYIAPTLEVFDINTTSSMLLTMSINDQEVDTSGDGVQLGRDDNSSNRPSNPNLWDQTW